MQPAGEKENPDSLAWRKSLKSEAVAKLAETCHLKGEGMTEARWLCIDEKVGWRSRDGKFGVEPL